MSTSLFQKIRLIVKKIPKGKVMTYGQVARLAGIGDARKVGWALYGNQDPKVPCHRVIKAEGFLASRYSLGGAKEQKSRLIKEGVKFVAEWQVDMEKHAFPGVS